MSSGFCIWFTGLPSSGKSTIAQALSAELGRRHILHDVLDGDHMRKILSSNLGFTLTERVTNINRVAFVASRIVKYGGVVITACITPYLITQQNARTAITAEGPFVEVYVNTPLRVCEERDPKGLYRLAREKKIPHFTGVSDIYNAPKNPELTIDGANSDPQTSAIQIINYLLKNRLIT